MSCSGPDSQQDCYRVLLAACLECRQDLASQVPPRRAARGEALVEETTRMPTPTQVVTSPFPVLRAQAVAPEVAQAVAQAVEVGRTMARVPERAAAERIPERERLGTQAVAQAVEVGRTMARVPERAAAVPSRCSCPWPR